MATENVNKLVIDATIITSLLATCEHMGTAAKIETDAQRAAAGEKQIVWRDWCAFGAKCLKEANGDTAHAAAVFTAHWLATKPELVKPANVSRYGSVPSDDGKGYKVNKYLGECVSRIKGALERGIAVTNDKGGAKGLNEVANAVAEWNKAQKLADQKKAEREANKADPQRKTRIAIAGKLVEIADSVKNGKHDSATLNKVEGYLSDIAKILKASQEAIEKAEAAEKAEALKEAQAAAVRMKKVA